MSVFDTAQLYPHSSNRLPSNARCQFVESVDRMKIRVMTAGRDVPRGTVVVLPGRGDFIERYFETTQELIKRGFMVVCFDWRGQGGSQRLVRDRKRGYVKRFRHYDEDLNAVMTQIVAQCPAPYLGLGHSTGGHMLLRAVKEQSMFSRVVVISPLLDFNFGSWPRSVAVVLAHVVTGVGLGRMFLPGYRRGPMTRSEFPNNVLTSDQARWDRDMTTLEQFPELGVGGPTFAWFRAALISINRLKGWSRQELIACPTLIITAGQEQVVDPHAAREFCSRVAGASFMQIAGSRHEILMEKAEIRDQFWAAFDSFVADSS